MKTVAVAQAPEPRVAAAPAALRLDVPQALVAPGRASVRSTDLADSAARLLIIVLFSFMAVRLGANFLETGRLTGLLLLVSEAIVVVLTVFRRPPQVVDRTPPARILTTLAMIGPPIVAPAALPSLVGEAAAVSVSAVGLLVIIAGKLSLGRSFGLMPANRGIVSSGLYRCVRHPIYLGYFITHVAFVAANPSPWNLIVLLVSDVAQVARALREEHTLAEDPAYREYQGRVRWRIVPGLF